MTLKKTKPKKGKVLLNNCYGLVNEEGQLLMSQSGRLFVYDRKRDVDKDTPHKKIVRVSIIEA